MGEQRFENQQQYDVFTFLNIDVDMYGTLFLPSFKGHLWTEIKARQRGRKSPHSLLDNQDYLETTQRPVGDRNQSKTAWEREPHVHQGTFSVHIHYVHQSPCSLQDVQGCLETEFTLC